VQRRLRRLQPAGRADGDFAGASMTAHLGGYIGAGERKRVPLGASCVVKVASETTRRLRVDSGRVVEVRSTSCGRNLIAVLTITLPVDEDSR
jgi:hypothetical protein